MDIIYMDGKFLPADQAAVPADDLSVLRGIGVCDIMRTRDNEPVQMEAHLKRLADSARQIGLDIPWTQADLETVIRKTLEKNSPGEPVNIRTIITGGSSPDYFFPSGDPRLIVMLTPLIRPPALWYEKGVKVITTRQERQLPGAKHTSYIPAVLAMKKARDQGAVEAIYRSRDDEMLEGASSNLFMVQAQQIITPPVQRVLNGTTRQAVMAVCADPQTPVRSGTGPVAEKTITHPELLKADEIFITGTNKGVVPVVNVDGTRIGDGRPGPVSRAVRQAVETSVDA